MGTGRTLVQNRQARFNYEILEKVEAGIALEGTEVKAIREGKANIKEAYADIRSGEAWLIGAHISPYSHGNITNHDPLLIEKKNSTHNLSQRKQKRPNLLNAD